MSTDLTAAVRTARRGLRSDVAVLVRSLEEGELLVPLARSLAGVPVGERTEAPDELTLSPHLLADPESRFYAALFTRADLLEAAGARAGWDTGGGPLEYCSLPARVGLELALELVDDREVMGLVLNAGDESELLLRRHEISALAQGKPVPLVGYVREIPERSDERSLVADTGEPPPRAIVEAIERCLSTERGIAGYALARTFNSERDLEPHWTLTLESKGGSVDLSAIERRLAVELADELPPPGYIDIVFAHDSSDAR